MISALRLTAEGGEHVDTRIVDHPEFRLVGHAARARLVHQGINPHIQRHITDGGAPALEGSRQY
jgi:AraC family transcriptional regulator